MSSHQVCMDYPKNNSEHPGQDCWEAELEDALAEATPAQVLEIKLRDGHMIIVEYVAPSISLEQNVSVLVMWSLNDFTIDCRYCCHRSFDFWWNGSF